ncbi:MAG: TIGR01777 family protein [Proteobacteria bacterium]|nr:TIGR01777 family protein [Pseudomonadota bacterium]
MKRMLSFSVRLHVRAELAYAWHEQDSAFNRLRPAWDATEMLSTEGLREGARAVIAMSTPAGRLLWKAEHFGISQGLEFSDRQLSGPFKFWQHRHRFVPVSENECELRDEITYELPLSPLSDVIAGWFVRRQLSRMFGYRHRILFNDLTSCLHLDSKSEANQKKEGRTMRILLTGSSGLIGSELAAYLRTQGHEVIGLSRRSSNNKDTVQWDLTQPAPQRAEALQDGRSLDAVIHLAGEGIAEKRWTRDQKQRLVETRVQATENLISGLGRLGLKPRVFICASGVGYYGDRHDLVLTEKSDKGEGFLAELAERWEAAAKTAEVQLSARCVQLRMSTVISARGGALKKMLLPFQMGAGGPLGHGRQWMSWVALDDVLYAIGFILNNEQISGPVNLVSPEPVTNAEFSKTLGRVLNRPAILPAPSFALRLALGEMADQLLLCSQRAVPQVLSDAGFNFRYPALEGALRHTLGKDL